MKFLTELTLWFESFAETDLAIYALAVGSFSESIIFPIPVDVLLVPMSLLNPPMAIWFGIVSMIASVLGGLIGYWFGVRLGRPALRKFVSSSRSDRVERLFDKNGAWAVVAAAVTPIPYKVFTIIAGVLNLELKKFVLASIIGIVILGMDFYLIIIAILVLVTIFFFVYYRPASEIFFKQITKRKFFSKYVENISDFYEIVHKSTNVKVATICILLALTYWFMVSAAAYYTLIAFDINILDYLKVLAIYATSTLLGAISFIPAGIGITEGSITGLFTLNGIDVSTALILSVMIRVFTLWYSVGVGFISLKFTGGFSFKKNSF